MNNIPLILISILVLIMVFGIFALHATRIRREEFKKTGKHPKGHYLRRGIALGVALGLPIGVAMGNIAIGIGIGIPLGAAIGSTWEKKHADSLRPLTAAEEKLKTQTFLLLTASMLVGVLVFFATNSIMH